MKKLFFSLTIVIVLTMVLIISCKPKSAKESFTFAFMTDVHLTYDRNAVPGFKQAISTVNDLNPDFVIMGGDQIMDALAQRFSQADSLYNLYNETIKNFKMPVFNTMGNHEIYGILSASGADPQNPEYGEKMFEKRIGYSYKSFSHKGWKFMILNSIEDTGKDRYIGKIDDAQIEWIKKELNATDKNTPIVLSTHIPFITANTQKYVGTTVPNDSSTVIYNGKEVLDLFKGYNLKLVLQGHLHSLEDIYIDRVHFITGGAVSSGWWSGPYNGIEEGYLLLTAGDNDISWKYIDFGWEVKK
ncbi:MAG TPA: metallophosphoesterase [Bacteroidales bacterium]|nr:metallophosphoesterase [Bacteroidales bacterium]